MFLPGIVHSIKGLRVFVSRFCITSVNVLLRCIHLSSMAKLPDYPVLIPYSELCELLETTKLIKEYKAEVDKYKKQLLALRIMQQECFEKLREIERSL